MAKNSTVGITYRVYDQTQHGTRTAVASFHRVKRELLQLAAGYYGARGLIRVLNDATKAAMAAEESENLYAVSLGRHAAATRQWSQQLSAALGLNQYAVRQQVATFNTMFDSLGMTDEAALQMSKSITQLAYDMASFYNLEVEDAFRKLQAGITGEVEPLKRLGIVVNETMTKEYALRQGWIKQGETLSEIGKVHARFGAIVEQTRTAQGDLARTQDSTTNITRSLNAQWTESKIILGEALLPAVNTVAGAMRDWLSENRLGIKRWASDFVEGVGIVIGALSKLNPADTEFREQFDRLPKRAQESLQAAFESETGHRMGYQQLPTTGAVPFGVANPYAELPTRETFMTPSGADLTYARRLVDSYARAYGVDPMSDLRKRLETVGAETTLSAIAPDASVAAGGTAGTEMATKAARDIAKDMARMYDQIDARSEESFAARRALIESEAEEYRAMGMDQAVVDQWVESQWQDLMLERARVRGTFWEGYGAEVAQMNRELETAGELGARVARTFREDMTDGLTDVIFQARSLSDVLTSVAEQIARLYVSRNISTPVVQGLESVVSELWPASTSSPAAGTGTGSEALPHLAEGGIITRRSLVVAGENEPEVIAPLNKLKTSAPSVRIEFHNEGTPMTAEVQSMRFDEELEEMVVSIVAKHEIQGGPLAGLRDNRRRG